MRRPPSGRVAYVDGRYVRHGQARVHIEDRGLQLGDSIYEVMRIAHGQLEDEELHLDRLDRSLAAIAMALPMARPPLKVVCREVVRRNVLSDGLLYLQVTRGAFRRDHTIPSVPTRPTMIVTARSFDVPALGRRRARGVAVVTSPDLRWGRCDIKSTQLLANVLAKTDAHRQGATEAWLVDKDGFVTEGASTTAWIVDTEGCLITRPLSHAVLPGVTRQVLVKIAAEAQIPIVERAFTPAEAGAAAEAFLTSASGTAVPVVTIDAHPVGDGKPGPVTRRIMDLFAARSL